MNVPSQPSALPALVGVWLAAGAGVGWSGEACGRAGGVERRLWGLLEKPSLSRLLVDELLKLSYDGLPGCGFLA